MKLVWKVMQLDVSQMSTFNDSVVTAVQTSGGGKSSQSGY